VKRKLCARPSQSGPSVLWASATGVLAVDDATGMGVLDDVALPVTVAGGGALFVNGEKTLFRAFGF